MLDSLGPLLDPDDALTLEQLDRLAAQVAELLAIVDRTCAALDDLLAQHADLVRRVEVLDGLLDAEQRSHRD